MSSKCDATVYFDTLPFIREVKALASAGIVPGGSFNNLEYVQNSVDFNDLTRTEKLMVCDAQTSGGLLIALNEKMQQNCLLHCIVQALRMQRL